MAVITKLSTRKASKRPTLNQDTALAFIDSIESNWKGHEPFVFWLVQHLQPKVVVDLGFDRGFSTIVFAYRNRGQVFGIDWFDGANYLTKCFALDTAFRNISNAIRFQYAKNIDLIVGPFKEIAKNWNRKIDILHINSASTYGSAQLRYNQWSHCLQEESVILVHDIEAFPNETGRFFHDLPLCKAVFPHSQGLGVACKNPLLIEKIKAQFFAN